MEVVSWPRVTCHPDRKIQLTVGCGSGAEHAVGHFIYVYSWRTGKPPASPAVPSPGSSADSPPAGTVNLARGKQATQSSDYAEIGWPEVAAYGVDGIKDPAGDPRGMFHTRKDDPPLWKVDVGEAHELTEIRLFNRVHPDVVDRARTVRVLISTTGGDWTEVYAHDGKRW